VQGGLCIQHGAKRKVCRVAGCTKHVKKSGLCSAHGPARKRCEFPDCNKVAVQGGKCIAHGAKKRLCCIEDCKKQAIMQGHCKKHYDMHVAKKEEKKGHKRGLSIFSEMKAVNTIINNKDLF